MSSLHFKGSGNIIGASAWETGAIITNPGANAVLVDSGALTVGWYFFQFLMHASVAATFDRQHRNAANSATLDGKQIPIPADAEQDSVFALPLFIPEGERFRVLNVDAFTGTAQASITWGRLDG